MSKLSIELTASARNSIERKRELHRMEKLWGQAKETSTTSADNKKA